MPQIEISDDTLALLKRHAEPLVDTFDTIITRFGHAFEVSVRSGHDGMTPIAIPRAEPSVKVFPADAPPDLTHTKVLSAKIYDSTVANRANWNGILKQMIQIARARARNEDDLRRLISVNFIMGRKEDEGYEYLPSADVSVQGQDTNAAWKGIVHLSQQLGIPVEVVFLWRHKAKAAYPGKTGRLLVGRPSSN